MTTNLSLTTPVPSRFVERWLAADPARASLLERMAGLTLSELDFDGWLAELQANAPSLRAAMRRLRNLLVSAIVVRDVSGRADLSEVVAAISAFADFVVRKMTGSLKDILPSRH
mgnify:CR=1 FL=1